MTCTVLCRDLASKGYIVFAPNHQDGSCLYTETSSGTPILVERALYYVKDIRQRQVNTRVSEVLALVNELTEMKPEFYDAIFGHSENSVQQ